MVVYFHRNPKTNEVFYVGIGKDHKRPKQVTGKGRSIFWHRYVAKHGHPIIEIVHTDLVNKDAYLLERKYISQFGKRSNGGTLVNLSDGGESGTFGTIASDEKRKKISLAHKGKIVSEETRRKLSIAKKGTVISDSTKEKLRIKTTGFKHPESSLIKRSVAHKGRKHSIEHRDNLAKVQSKIYLNTQTGIFYYGLREASSSIGMPMGTFDAQINGRLRNKTHFVKTWDSQ